MSERLQPRQFSQETDVPVVTSFSGLTSATYTQTGDPIGLQKLVNAFVDVDGSLRQRPGSTALTWAGNISDIARANPKAFAFTFDGLSYVIIRINGSVIVYLLDNSKNVVNSRLVSNVYDATVDYTNAVITFTQVVEGDVCYILMTDAFNQMTALVFIRRTATFTAVTSGSTGTLSISEYPAANVLNAASVLLLTTNNQHIALTSLTQSLFELSIVTSSPTALATAVPGNQAKVHMLFWTRMGDSNYYQGSNLYNIGLRRNSVPLDVNVQVPGDMFANPISYERQELPLTFKSYYVFKTNENLATEYTKVINRKPATADEWDFSDGSYRAEPNVFTVQSPAFVAFGGLQAGGQSAYVYIVRLRNMLLANGANITLSSVKGFINKLPFIPTYFDGAGGLVLLNGAKYFAFLDRAQLGLPLSSVCELVLTINQAGLSSTTDVIDITPGQTSISIANGNVVPLYGTSGLASVVSLKYPPIVLNVGNRTLLTGSSNRVSLSNADWLYRGVAWNNFQVSDISFSETSAFDVLLSQGVTTVTAALAINGVIIVGTNAGVFRISGDSPTTPPSATKANVGKLSNDSLLNNECIATFDNKIFYVTKSGLWQLQYSQETNELENKCISADVSDWFRKYTADAIVFSPTLRSFVVSFADNNKLLAFNLASQTFYTIAIATNAKPRLNSSFDGYTINLSETGGTSAYTLCYWNAAVTTDISNAASVGGLSSATVLTKNAVVISPSSTNVDSLSIPSELVSSLSSNVTTSYGDNSVRVFGLPSLTVEEGVSGKLPIPIVSYVVTNAFSSEALDRVYRVRAYNLLATGTGALVSRVAMVSSDYSDRVEEWQANAINSSGEYVGELLLNAEYAQVRASNGDVVRIKERLLNTNENWALAMAFSSQIVVIGLAFETSRKGRRKLN